MGVIGVDQMVWEKTVAMRLQVVGEGSMTRRETRSEARKQKSVCPVLG